MYLLTKLERIITFCYHDLERKNFAMTRYEAINIAFRIKEDPNNHDFSSYLYSAVGLLKREPGPGTAFAAHQLVCAIKGSGKPISEFCQRKIEIIEKAYMDAMCKNLTTLAEAQARVDAQQELRALGRM